VAALGKLYTALTGEDREDFRDVEDAHQHLAERLKDRTCLVILDDVWNPDHLQPFLRSGRECAWLITTRQFEVAAEAELVTVEEMTPRQAVNLLTARLDRQPAQADIASFHELARRLSAWPLLLELAGAALNREVKRGLTLGRALDYLSRELGKKGVTAFDPRNAEDRRRSVAGTIEVSLERLPESDRFRLAELTIFPLGVDIPLSAAGSLWGLGDDEAENHIRLLHDLSVLKPDRDFQTVQLHDVLRIYLAGRLNDSERQVCHARLVDAWGDPFHLGENFFAWRWIGYHLIAAGRPEVFRTLLLDPSWIEAKLLATSPSALTDDYAHFSSDGDLALIEKAMRLHSQITGRLLSFNSPVIRGFLDRLARSRRQPWLRPQSACLTLPGGPLLRIFEGHQGHVRGVAVSPDGRRLLSTSDDKTVRVWDLETGMTLRVLQGHGEAVWAVALTPDGRRAISASRDKTLKVWDLRTGGMLRTLEGHQEGVNAVAVTPDGRLAVSGSEDKTLKVWDLGTGGGCAPWRGTRRR
jgi:WD40 domain-containing protein/apoptotic protease-activating factor 1-like protein/NB-ARC domain-containing protein